MQIIIDSLLLISMKIDGGILKFHDRETWQWLVGNSSAPGLSSFYGKAINSVESVVFLTLEKVDRTTLHCDRVCFRINNTEKYLETTGLF